jgi:hypothetical protein
MVFTPGNSLVRIAQEAEWTLELVETGGGKVVNKRIVKKVSNLFS